MKTTQEIAETIEILAKNKAVSIKQMLLECELNKDVLGHLKRGQMPSADKIAKIARYLEVSTDYLLGNTDDPTPPGAVKDLKYSDLDMSFYEGVDLLTDEEKEFILKNMKFLISERQKKEQNKDK